MQTADGGDACGAGGDRRLTLRGGGAGDGEAGEKANGFMHVYAPLLAGLAGDGRGAGHRESVILYRLGEVPVFVVSKAELIRGN